jgi:hypothetical protein
MWSDAPQGNHSRRCPPSKACCIPSDHAPNFCVNYLPPYHPQKPAHYTHADSFSRSQKPNPGGSHPTCVFDVAVQNPALLWHPLATSSPYAVIVFGHRHDLCFVLRGAAASCSPHYTRPSTANSVYATTLPRVRRRLSAGPRWKVLTLSARGVTSVDEAVAWRKMRTCATKLGRRRGEHTFEFNSRIREGVVRAQARSVRGVRCDGCSLFAHGHHGPLHVRQRVHRPRGITSM